MIAAHSEASVASELGVNGITVKVYRAAGQSAHRTRFHDCSLARRRGVVAYLA